MKRLFMFLLVLSSCGASFAELCPKCSAAVLHTDAFCAGCGFDVLTWRNRRLEQPKAPFQSSQDLVERRSSVRQTSTPDLSEYSYTGTMLSYMKKSDVVTPLKLSLIGPAALPWDDGCTVYGLHLAVLSGSCHTLYGFNACGIGDNLHTLGGISCALFNMSHNACGFQIGFLNMADKLKGLQIGVINFADPNGSAGIQIGIFNTCKAGVNGDGWFFPGINVCF